MDIPLKQDAEATPKNKRGPAIKVLLLGFATGLHFNWVIRFLPTYEGSSWLKLGLSLSPWLLFVVFVRMANRIWRRDELEKLIDREALVFVFYGLMGGLILLGQLQAVDLAPRFKWDNGHILLVMILLLGAGMFWSRRRYR